MTGKPPGVFSVLGQDTPDDENSSVDAAIGCTLKLGITITNRISGGSFGQVFLAEKNANGTKKLYVVKQESNKLRRPHLADEFELIKFLQQGCEGITRVYALEKRHPYIYMVMDLKGPNLTELFNVSGKHFSSKTVAKIFLQVLPTFKYIHAHGILHRDMKPENITCGRWPTDAHRVYVIDFGLAKQYVFRGEDDKKCHIPLRNPRKIPKANLTGTVRYASVHAHYGDQGRRDDLESFGNVMMYFLKGGWLPWMGVTASTKKEKYLNILELKKNADMQELFSKNYREFRIYMESVRSMRFAEKPDYDFYIKLFERLVKRKNWDANRGVFDWDRDDLLEQEWPRFA